MSIPPPVLVTVKRVSSLGVPGKIIVHDAMAGVRFAKAGMPLLDEAVAVVDDALEAPPIPLVDEVVVVVVDEALELPLPPVPPSLLSPQPMDVTAATPTQVKLAKIPKKSEFFIGVPYSGSFMHASWAKAQSCRPRAVIRRTA